MNHLINTSISNSKSYYRKSSTTTPASAAQKFSFQMKFWHQIINSHLIVVLSLCIAISLLFIQTSLLGSLRKLNAGDTFEYTSFSGNWPKNDNYHVEFHLSVAHVPRDLESTFRCVAM